MGQDSLLTLDELPTILQVETVYLSEAIDQFSLNFLKARDEVSADLERWLHSID